MVVVGEPAAGETSFVKNLRIFVDSLFKGGIWPSGKAAIFDVVSVGSNPSIPSFIQQLKNVYLLGTGNLEY